MQSNFLGWLKKFGPAQNILGPVKGQGINIKQSTFVISDLFIVPNLHNNNLQKIYLQS